MRVHTSAYLESQRSPAHVRRSSCLGSIGYSLLCAPVVAIRQRYGSFVLSHDVRGYARRFDAAIVPSAAFIDGDVCRWIATWLDLASVSLSPLRRDRCCGR